jgi:ubiquinone/menaquinone biosynthesis C-methylase UbiE
VANPFHWGLPRPGERVVDVGSGTGMDAMVAANAVGEGGRVVGVDMTPEMLERARAGAEKAGMKNVEFREGLAEQLPVEDGWADLVISNGAINLVPDKLGAYREIARVLAPGGSRRDRRHLRREARSRIGAQRHRSMDRLNRRCLPRAGWVTVIEGAGLVEVEFGPIVDTFGGAGGEDKARQYGTYGYPIRARKP